jgi:hypothetical protein
LKPHQAKLIKWFDKYKVFFTQAELDEETPNIQASVRNEGMNFDSDGINN